MSAVDIFPASNGCRLLSITFKGELHSLTETLLVFDDDHLPILLIFRNATLLRSDKYAYLQVQNYKYFQTRAIDNRFYFDNKITP